MARDQRKRFSAEIDVVKNSGADVDGTADFSMKVQPASRDFLSSIRISPKYIVKLGYGYLLSPRLCLLIVSILAVSFSTSAESEKLKWQDLCPKFELVNGLFFVGLLAAVMYVYLDLTPKPTYLLDFACYRPPDDLKVTLLYALVLTNLLCFLIVSIG